MTLLDFAKGPGLRWSLIILVAGTLWRLTALLLLRQKKSLAEPRDLSTVAAALRTVVKHSWPRKEFRPRMLRPALLSYTFHIGLAIVVFGGTPHIQFIKGLFGLSWPGLPGGVIFVSATLSLGALIALLVRRVTHPVLRRISTFDDYTSWLVTTAPLVTGILAFTHLGARYETMLAVHILSVEVLFVWFPFGKLMHAVLVSFTRGATGAAFARKGVQL